MKDGRSAALGAMLKARRVQLAVSIKELADAAKVPASTVLRFERGAFTAPSPDKLVTFARLLGLSVADVFTKAGYIFPGELPTFPTYLTAKYPDLPAAAVSRLTHLFVEVAEEYKIDVQRVSGSEVAADDLAGATP